MEVKQTNLTSKLVNARELLPQLRQIPLFQQVKEEDLDCLGEVEVVDAPARHDSFRSGGDDSLFLDSP